MIKLESVSLKKKDTQVLKNITFNIDSGQRISIVGPSGSGKTSILRVIAGFENIKSGKLLINKTDASMLSPYDRNIGYVFQNLALWPHMNVHKHLDFQLKGQTGLDKSERHEKIVEMLKYVSLDGKEKRYPAELSGGRKPQDLAIARAIVSKPRILLFDEPLSSLDHILKKGDH